MNSHFLRPESDIIDIGGEKCIQRTINKVGTMKMNMQPEHPGVIFKSEILDRLELSITEAAKRLGISRKALSDFCNGKTPCTVNMSKRIAYAINSNAAVWINLQANYDAWSAQKNPIQGVMKFPEEPIRQLA